LHAALASREMAALLASDRAENITGAAFNVDGGWEMH
jgi:NAD(P)-dependent dehydrogenase (short-subunit alcohol dehydrogenase family)